MKTDKHMYTIKKSNTIPKYSVMKAEVAQDKSLSLAARGLYALIMSLDDEKIDDKGEYFSSFHDLKADEINALLDELENADLIDFY